MPSAAARPSARERAIAARATIRKLGPGLIAPSVSATTMLRTAAEISTLILRLAHELADLGRRQRTLDEAEGAFFLHFPRRFHQAGHGAAPQRSGEADALDAGGLELGDAEGFPADAGHEVERLGERRTYLAHRLEVWKSGRHEDVGARLFERLQPPDGVDQVRPSAHEILRPRRQDEVAR